MMRLSVLKTCKDGSRNYARVYFDMLFFVFPCSFCRVFIVYVYSWCELQQYKKEDGARSHPMSTMCAAFLIMVSWPGCICFAAVYGIVLAIRWLGILLGGYRKEDASGTWEWTPTGGWPPPPPPRSSAQDCQPGKEGIGMMPQALSTDLMSDVELAECTRNHGAPAGPRPERESWAPAPLPPLNFNSSIITKTTTHKQPFRSKIKTTKPCRRKPPLSPEANIPPASGDCLRPIRRKKGKK